MFESVRSSGRCRPVVALAVAVAGVSLLAGCGGSDEKAAAPATTAAVDPQKVSPTDLPQMPKLKQAKGAIADATFGECSTKAGKATVKGSITNSGKDASSYGIAVNWINTTSDVMARAVEEIDRVAPDETRNFKVTTTVPAGVDSCTFYVVRGTAR